MKNKLSKKQEKIGIILLIILAIGLYAYFGGNNPNSFVNTDTSIYNCDLTASKCTFTLSYPKLPTSNEHLIYPIYNYNIDEGELKGFFIFTTKDKCSTLSDTIFSDIHGVCYINLNLNKNLDKITYISGDNRVGVNVITGDYISLSHYIGGTDLPAGSIKIEIPLSKTNGGTDNPDTPETPILPIIVMILIISGLIYIYKKR